MLVALTELDLALAAVITTAILGIVGAVMTWLVAKQNRQHERQIAHDTRLYERRSTIYVEMLVDLRRQVRQFQRVSEWARALFTDPAAPAPNPGVVLPSDEETDQLRSRVAAFGSQEMVDLLSEFGEKGACDRSPPGR